MNETFNITTTPPYFLKIIPKLFLSISILENVCLITLIIARFLKERIRSVNLLIGNLSLVALLTALFSDFFIWELKSFSYCPLFRFLNGLFYDLTCASVLSLSYDRLRRLRRGWGDLSNIYVVFGLWIFSIFWAIPIYFEVGYDSETETCLIEPMFGEIWVRDVFICIRFYVFHTTLTLFLFFCVYQSRTKFHYLLQRTQCRKQKRRIHRMQLICLNPFLFIMMWASMELLRDDSYSDLILGIYLIILAPLTYWISDDISLTQAQLCGRCCIEGHMPREGVHNFVEENTLVEVNESEGFNSLVEAVASSNKVGNCIIPTIVLETFV